MAIEDYYIDLYYVDLTRVPDGMGGFEYAYRIGESFKGSAVRSPASEQEIAGIRGELQEQYNVTTAKGNVLQKDDILMFIDKDKQQVFLRVNSNALHTPESAINSAWKGVSATKIIPDYRVVE